MKSRAAGFLVGFSVTTLLLLGIGASYWGGRGSSSHCEFADSGTTLTTRDASRNVQIDGTFTVTGSGGIVNTGGPITQSGGDVTVADSVRATGELVSADSVVTSDSVRLTSATGTVAQLRSNPGFAPQLLVGDGAAGIPDDELVMLQLDDSRTSAAAYVDGDSTFTGTLRVKNELYLEEDINIATGKEINPGAGFAINLPGTDYEACTYNTGNLTYNIDGRDVDFIFQSDNDTTMFVVNGAGGGGGHGAVGVHVDAGSAVARFQVNTSESKAKTIVADGDLDPTGAYSVGMDDRFLVVNTTGNCDVIFPDISTSNERLLTVYIWSAVTVQFELTGAGGFDNAATSISKSTQYGAWTYMADSTLSRWLGMSNNQ